MSRQFSCFPAQGKSGTNLFAIVRAYRAIPEEAILVVVQNAGKQVRAVATALSLALHSSSKSDSGSCFYTLAKSYWARDLVFLFVDGREPLTGTQAFLAAYNGDPLASVVYDPLETNSGFLIGGLCLDLEYDFSAFYQVQYVSVSCTCLPALYFALFVLGEWSAAQPGRLQLHGSAAQRDGHERAGGPAARGGRRAAALRRTAHLQVHPLPGSVRAGVFFCLFP